MSKIERHTEGVPGNVKLIFLGDYVDRGDESRQVVQRLMEISSKEFAECIFLKGNHEQVFLEFLVDSGVGRNWFQFGGMNTILSYQVPVRKVPTTEEDYEEIRLNFSERVPESHKRFLFETLSFYELGNCFFVHAGIRPKVPLIEQSPEDLLWIKEEFTSSKKVHEKLIVHGHTIEDQVAILPNRIGLDTGAYASGLLSCAVLEGNEVELLQVQI